MRILFDIDEREIETLDRLSGEADRSRASLIREAIAEFLARRRPDAVTASFGLWGRDGAPAEDGLAFQERLRAEW